MSRNDAGYKGYILPSGERDYWKLHEDVCFGRAGGRVIWQPRIGCWITDRMFADGKLPGIYEGLTIPQIYQKLDCSNRIYDYNGCFTEYRDPTDNVSGGGRWLNADTFEHYIDTPLGRVSTVVKKSPNSWAMLTAKRWVTCEDDLKVWIYLEKTAKWRWNQPHYDAVKAEWGRQGAPSMYLPRVSIQRLYIDLMGVAETIYALQDYPDTVEEYLKALRGSHMRMIEVINGSPLQLIDFGDNLHSGTLSPALFRKYVLGDYQLRCEALHRAGKFVYAHYDGNNRGLQEMYHETGLDGIEAITPVPQGDVTLDEMKQHLGDMYLLDGLPAVFFDEEFPVSTLEDCVKRLLELFAPHLVLGISDEISSTGDIERVRRVGELVDEYNAKL